MLQTKNNEPNNIITSLWFSPRGLGSNSLQCFLCPGSEKNAAFLDCAFFVNSRAEAYQAAEWFRTETGWLELGDAVDVCFRYFEPRWIQVKVGACTDHKHRLTALIDRVGASDNVLTLELLQDVLGPPKRRCTCRIEHHTRYEANDCPIHNGCQRVHHQISVYLDTKDRATCFCGHAHVEVIRGHDGTLFLTPLAKSGNDTVYIALRNCLKD